jgi:hypothetical protein
MRKLEKVTLIVGCSGIAINLICIAIGNPVLGYAANLVGRVSGTLYMISVDKFRSEYLLPITLAAINVVVVEEMLLFTELMVSSCIYQLNAFRFFSKKK